MCICSLCAGLGNYCPGGVNLVIGDMPPIPFGAHPPGHAEYHSKRQLLSQLTCAYKVIHIHRASANQVICMQQAKVLQS